MKIIFAATLIVLLSAEVGAVDMLTGEKLLARCQSEESPLKVWCSGYILGVAEASEAAPGAASSEGGICTAGDAVSSKQLKSAAISYLESHPQDLHGNAASLLLNAYQEAFPCK